MKDRLTKKRVKVDYEAIITLLDLCYEFRVYQFQRRKNLKPIISERREMISFLRSRDVNFYWCQLAINDNCKNLADLINYCGSYKAALEYAYGL